MNEYSKLTPKKIFSRDAIIGLGEDSIRKNYYPELQDRLLELEKINSRNRALITAIPDMLFVSDTSGNISPYTIPKDKDKNIYVSIMRNSELIKTLRSMVFEVISERKLLQMTFELNIYEQLRFFETRIHISEFEEVLLIIRDITEQVTLERTLRHMAEKDSLCDVYNRRFFENYLSNFNQKEQNGFTILIIDIDGLKLINDTLGHYIGDQMIITVSDIIKKCFDDIGIISRIGGDEFGVIMENQTIQVIESGLKQLHLLISKYNHDNTDYTLSLSNGYGYHSEGILDVKTLYQLADNNMFQNKLLKSSSVKNNLVKTLMKTLEAKDYITEGHADRMETLATQIGQELSLTQSMIDRIQLLTKFHDIGKVGIPDSILKKPGSLTPDEWKIMRTHSHIGERIANESSELRDISHLILKHHEKWDGTGYPLGISGTDIPIECRILAIVDTFDAMTNDRPYRKALSYETAIAEIKANRGKQFDPMLVDLFERLSIHF